MRKFKIVYKKHYTSHFVSSLRNLSRNISYNCEIYEVTDDELYIGHISKKSFLFISVNIADYFLRNFARRRENFSEKILKSAESCVDVSKRWLDDPESVLAKEAGQLAMQAIMSSNVHPSRILSATSSCTLFVSGLGAEGVISNSIRHSLDALEFLYLPEEEEEKEQIRQGNFILDFTSSGKSLFMD